LRVPCRRAAQFPSTDSSAIIESPSRLSTVGQRRGAIGRNVETMEDMSSLAVVVLAAGKGTRMKSNRAKVLHPLCGQPMMGHLLRAAEQLSPARLLVVIGRDAEQVREGFAGRAEFVLQAEQRGTGHAVLQAMPKLEGSSGEVLILYGDTPLLRPETLEEMQQLKRRSGADLVMLSALLPLPGRVVRDREGRVERIVETTDATPEELRIEEGNTGVYLIDLELLREGLAAMRDDNEQGELYITDVVGHAVRSGRGVEALMLDDAEECLGVNNRRELAQAGAVLRRRTAERLMDEGVSIVDPNSTWIDVDVEVGQDTVIEPGCVIQGATVIGESVRVRPGCTIESSRIDDGLEVGPHAHLPPGTHVTAMWLRGTAASAPKKTKVRARPKKAGAKARAKKAGAKKARSKKKAARKKAGRKTPAKKGARKKAGARKPAAKKAARRR